MDYADLRTMCPLVCYCCSAQGAEKVDDRDGGIDMVMVCRGVRGATCAENNTSSAIMAATRDVLAAMIEANSIDPADIASMFFTVSDDLDAAYPAAAARELGLAEVCMLCAREIPVPGSPARCIRVLAHLNTTKPQSEIEHVYIGDAATLRPDRRWPRGPKES